ncbi:MAG: GNAT family N-acetyltransferase [Rhodobacteraceae bacterium]|nr:GNAT family N-acetyltransferase [Paracoccaceae bacterium]
MTETIRPFTPADAEPLYRLFRNAVQNAAPHYTQAQRDAWAPHAIMPTGWPKRIADMTTWVAEDNKGHAGFLSLQSDGYLDFLYVRPDLKGQGTAGRLYTHAADHARQNALSMTTHASLFARPFFERQGWRVIHREEVPRGDQYLTRFFMAAPATE